MATQPIKDPKARVVNPSYDQRGVPHWTMRLSPPDDTFAMCLMVPDRVIPVIFVPGVMGSNLIEKGRDADKAMTWLLDDTLTAARWTLIDRGAETRKKYLHPQVMEVNENGAIPQGTAMPDEELRRRGWGEVGALSYGPWLVWLENALNDFEDPHAGERVKLTRESLRAELGEALLQRDEVGLSYKYRFPVHACGYNWLDSNAASAKRLGQRIGAIIERYTKEGNRCEKVIIVTHSMGGWWRGTARKWVASATRYWASCTGSCPPLARRWCTGDSKAGRRTSTKGLSNRLRGRARPWHWGRTLLK